MICKMANANVCRFEFYGLKNGFFEKLMQDFLLVVNRDHQSQLMCRQQRWDHYVQNAAVRLIFELTPRDHITPSLLQLHWRIEYKLCCIMHSVHTGRCPAYLKNTVQFAVAEQSRSDLRSSSTSAYLLPRLKTKFGERAFSHAGPLRAWVGSVYPRPRRS